MRLHEVGTAILATMLVWGSIVFLITRNEYKQPPEPNFQMMEEKQGE